MSKIQYNVCDMCGEKINGDEIYTLGITKMSLFKMLTMQPDYKKELCMICKNEVTKWIEHKKIQQ